LIRKYATLQVLESWRAPRHGAADVLRKRAHRVGFDYQPRPGYLYVRSRMISSRCNDNHDEFPANEIVAGYKTFLGKPVFVNHHNASHRRARGVIVAVALHRDRNPDGTPDTWVEGLMEVDAVRFPKLAQAILAGRVNRTSMGVDVERSTCSACGNVATSPAEYCKHLPAMKGKKHRRRVEGKVREEIIREVCAGLSFFENSLLVEDPADPTAYVLGKPDARGLSMAASMRPAETDFHLVEAAGRYQDPSEHPFFQANPVNSRYIVEAYNDSTDNEKALGHRWYSDAHHIAGAIAGGNYARGAGLLSAYSPQTSWPANLMNASNAHRNPENPPGKGSGAMGMHQKAASRILAGEDNNSVLKAPKTNAFAHLIEHGDDTEADKASGNHRVVIDRHAMSVAINRRVTKDDDMGFLGNPHYYEHVANAYRQAAADLNARYGQTVSPHQVQAVTWLRQQRLNERADAESAAGKGRNARTINDWRRWHEHQNEHHPDLATGENMHSTTPHQGSRKVAYGETKVPQQVDTLRAENCPVCGEQDVWSGDRCPVCGFVAPPDMFRDPDVDKAAETREELDSEGEVTLPPEGQVDNEGTPQGPVGDEQQGSFPDADNQMLHPDQLTPNGVPAVQGEDGSPVDPNAEQEQAAAEGEEDGEEPPEAEGEMLQCPACGEQLEAGTPGAEEGAPCPVCGNAPLEPVADDELAQKGQEPPQPGGSRMGAKEAARQAELKRVAAIERENQVLRAQLRFVAELAGVGPELERIRRQADVMNPASPVPDPPEAPPSETTEQALAPETMDDPSRPGTTPGSVTHVPAEQTTTAITPGAEIQTPPATQLVDVTAPVQGTNPSQDGGVPIEQRRIETDVRIDPDPLKASGPGIGGQGNDGTAFPWMMGQGQPQQKAASAEDARSRRTFASIRLAKLRVTAGLDRDDELAVATRIEHDAKLSLETIEHEIGTLGQLAQRAPAPGRPMQRAASRPAPSLAPAPQPMMAYASAASAGVDDSDLFLD
jgi:hypothetical protein